MSATPVPTASPVASEQRRAARVRRADRLARIAFTGFASFSLLVIVSIAVYVISEAWPSFSYNGLSWFTDSSVPLDVQLSDSFQKGTQELHAWPAIMGTILTTGGALLIAFPFSILAAIFIAELAPPWLVRVLEPVVTLLAGTPSVIFGLFAILAVGPLIDDHLLDRQTVSDYAPVVQISGEGLLLGIIVLVVMIAPIMVAIFVDALRAVPRSWREGAIAMGCDRWRATRRVSMAAIRPALIAGTGLAIGRALGEAIALSMATGSIGFTPNVLDGFNFFLEPVRPLASAIVEYSEGFDQPALRANLFAFGAVLLVASASMTIAARLISLPLERRLQGRA
jgi:phosphate ABC transporter permease protein PstC